MIASDVSTDTQSNRATQLDKKFDKKLGVDARKKSRIEAQEAKRMKKNNLTARRKGVTDVDTQCGVINDKGLPCSRSLTCKSHSMGAKRAVPGRSRPYDELLLDWQRIHNPQLIAKLEEKERAVAASKAAAAERKHRKALEKKRKKLLRAGVTVGPDGQSLTNDLTMQATDGSRNALAKSYDDLSTDMFTLGYTDEDVDREISDLLLAIQTVVHSDRTRILPMAQRNGSGLYTRRSHTLRSMRDLFRDGLQGASRTSASSLDVSSHPAHLVSAGQ